jgi:acyl-CoA synthetase (AMP-forming)/AMP-acid ligase II
MTTIVDAFQRIPRERPLVVAPLTGDTWTAAMVDDAAQRIAGHLVTTGVREGELVASLLGNHPAAIAVLLACRYARTPLLPVDASASAAEASGAIRRFGARAVIAAATAGVPPGCAPGGTIGDVTVGVPAHEPTRYPGIALLKLTSGSTGLPKATLTTEEQLRGDTASIVEAMGIRPDDTQVAVLPLSHAYAIGNLVVPLLLQGTAIIVRDGFNPHRVVEDAEAFGARVWPGVPFMFKHLLEHPPARWPRTLTHLISAGAPLDARTIAAMHATFGMTVHSFYGTSETGGIAFDERDAPPPAPASGFIVGRPMPGVTITLTPDDQAPPDGGRLHVVTRGVAAGYAGLEDDAFTGGGFLTGDLGRVDGEGRLVLTGRVSSFVNVAGRKVQPGEVEAVLREIDGVSDARVFGLPDEKRGETLVAFVVTDRAVESVGMRRHCAARLSAHKVPRAILALDAWPLTDRGKLDRAALTAAAAARLERPNH